MAWRSVSLPAHNSHISLRRSTEGRRSGGELDRHIAYRSLLAWKEVIEQMLPAKTASPG
jgi:hypothetical protein